MERSTNREVIDLYVQPDHRTRITEGGGQLRLGVEFVYECGEGCITTFGFADEIGDRLAGFETFSPGYRTRRGTRVGTGREDAIRLRWSAARRRPAAARR